MKRRPALSLLALLLAALSSPVMARQGPGAGAAAGPAAPASLQAGERQEIVASLGAALRNRYVFPDVGARAAAAIEAALAGGAYDAFAEPGAFAARLSADIEAVAHDKHLQILSTLAPPAPPPPAAAALRPQAQAGVVRADRLAGGVGYIEVIAFPPPPVFQPAVDKAMTGLAGSRTLIIDVRRNGGGSPEAVAYLVSFLVAPDRPINDVVSRVADTTDFTRQSYRSVPTPVGFADVPVFVLTSRQTFSGGEEFAYDVQALRRGTLVGEVTGGGANPTGFVDLAYGIGAAIPFGRAENPVTGTNWEGRGVQPDVPAPAADALAIALERAGQKPVATIEAASVARVFAPRSTPLPGSEAALRGVLAGFASGKPDYAAMTPEFAERMRGMVPEGQAKFLQLGSLTSLTFHGPDMLGGDEFVVQYEKGAFLMALILTPEGKVLAVSSPMPVPTPSATTTPPSRP